MFRLYQYQTDAMAPEIEAGDWVIQKLIDGQWRNHEGPYKYRDAAEIRLWHWQLTENPIQDFEGLNAKELPI